MTQSQAHFGTGEDPTVTQSTSTMTGTRWEMTGIGEPLVPVAFPLPEPAAGEALVRVAGCGVCHTDLGFLFDGVRPAASLPLALGHEISGEVIAAGAGFEHLAGKAVIVPAVTPCGACDACRSGHGSICKRQCMPGNHVPGGFGTHVAVPARGLCVVDEPGALAGKQLARSGCTLADLAVVADAVSTPYQAMRRARVAADDFVVVIGLGGVGGFAAQIARAFGATVVGFDVDPARLATLSEHGLAKGIDPTGAEPRALRDAVRAFAKESGARSSYWKIFECSGTAAGQELAWSMLCFGAYLSVVGYTMDKVHVRLSNLMAFDAKAVGNWGCLPELYPDALALVLEGRIALAPFIERYPMDDVWDVLNQVREHKIKRRPVLTPREDPA